MVSFIRLPDHAPAGDALATAARGALPCRHHVGCRFACCSLATAERVASTPLPRPRV